MSKTALVSKQEALEILSAQMRRTDLPANVIKSLTISYAKLAGWAIRESNSKFDREERTESTIQKRVLELEKKRREEKLQ